MATIRKKRNKWQVLIRKRNIKAISKTFILKEDALKWAKEVEVNIEKGLYQDNSSARSITLKQVLEEYRDKVSIHNKGHYIDKYKINKLCRYPLAQLTLANLSPLKLSEFIDGLKNKFHPSTINKYISLISLSFKYAEQILRIYIPSVPTKFITRLKVPPFKGKVITIEEETVWLKYAEQSKLYWLKTAIMLGIDCGVRRGEILKLKYTDINFRENTALLRDTKNGTNREIGLSKRVIEEIKKLPRTTDGLVFPCKRYDTFTFYFRQLQKKTGIFKRFHETRHTFASRRTTEGWSVTELAAQGGWLQLQVLKRYTHISPIHLAKKINTIM